MIAPSRPEPRTARAPRSIGRAYFRQDLADGIVEERVGDLVEGGGLRVHDDDLSARLARDVHRARHRVYLQARPYGEKQIRLARRRHGAVDDLGQELLAERYGVALQDAAAVAAVRVRLAGAHALEDQLHRAAHAAAPAHEPAHGAMHLDYARGGVSGQLVQLVDVLRDQRVQLVSLFELHQGPMTCVGLRAPRRAGKAALP